MIIYVISDGKVQVSTTQVLMIIYVFSAGGHLDAYGSPERGIYKFDPSTHEWNKLSDLLTGRGIFSTSIINFKEFQNCCVIRTREENIIERSKNVKSSILFH